MRTLASSTNPVNCDRSALFTERVSAREFGETHELRLRHTFRNEKKIRNNDQTECHVHRLLSKRCLSVSSGGRECREAASEEGREQNWTDVVFLSTHYSELFFPTTPSRLLLPASLCLCLNLSLQFCLLIFSSHSLSSPPTLSSYNISD